MVELTWLEKRIENRIRFGTDRPTNRASIVVDASCQLCAWQRLCLRPLGRATNTERSSRASTSCARSQPGERLSDTALRAPRRRHPVAALRLAESRTRADSDRCRSRRSASIRLRLRRTTGGSSSTVAISVNETLARLYDGAASRMAVAGRGSAMTMHRHDAASRYSPARR